MSSLTFRTATPADAPAVAALIELAYRGEAAASGWTNETGLLEGPRSSPAEIARLVAADDGVFVLGERDGVLVGTAHLTRVEDGAHFGMFAVDPAEQGAGLGKDVLAASERTARELWAAPMMTMSVISLRDDLIAWYERRGYRRTGRVLDFPFHEHSGALRTDFGLAELSKPL